MSPRHLKKNATLVPVKDSIGIATWQPRDDYARELLTQAADESLYAAKGGGRNRIGSPVAAGGS